MINRELDCLIVGGGPAGLTAAICLPRFHLHVSVVDEGSSRALLIPKSHNVPGFTDGLTEKFGGVTAYKRAPAQGRWKSGGQTQGDEIAIFQVVVDRFETTLRDCELPPGVWLPREVGAAAAS